MPFFYTYLLVAQQWTGLAPPWELSTYRHDGDLMRLGKVYEGAVASRFGKIYEAGVESR